MRWELSPEQELFGTTLASWLGRVAPSATVREWLEDNPGGFERALVDEGWLAVGFPEEWGGQGGGLIESALAAAQWGRHAVPSAAWAATVLAVPAVAGLPEASAALEEGQFLALAVDAANPVDHRDVSVDAGEGTVSGRVPAVLGADRAHKLVVPARTSSGTALFLVDTAVDGMALKPRTLIDRTRGVADVTLTDAPATRLDVDAAQIMHDAAQRAAVLVAADSLGAMERMLELAVDYSKQRHQFGVPIGSFQAVKHAAASLLVEVEAAKSVVYFAAASVEQRHPERVLHAAAAKAQVTAAGERSADTALTMHGAIGYTWEHDLHLFYKRAKLNRALFGAPSVWNERVASALPLVAAG